MSRKSKAAEFVDEEYSITITGRNVQVTEAIKNYALEKLSKIDKFNLRIVDVDITMDVQKIFHRVDIIVKVDHIVIKAHGVSDDLYASIDIATDKLQRQFGRYHSRIRDHQTKGGKEIEMDVSVLRPSDANLLEVNGDIEEANQRSLENRYLHSIVKKEKMLLKVLNHDEAIMKMELSGDPFLLFRSEEDRKLKLIYLKKDGNFGLIEPES